MKLHSKYFLILLGGFLLACNSPVQNEGEKQASNNLKNNVSGQMAEEINLDTSIVLGAFKLVSIAAKKEFKDIQLDLLKPKAVKLKEGIQQFQFQVSVADGTAELSTFEVGLLLNNELIACKSAENAVFDIQLLEGNNVVFAFVKEKGGASIKHTGSSYFKNFYVGEGESSFDVNQPQLFYLQPNESGDVAGDNNQLLDFYLINTTLSKDNLQLKVIVDTTATFLTHWAAFYIQGLEKGKHSFRLQLLDANRKAIPGPFNDSGTREVINGNAI